jgi:hypothetical protein
MCQWDQTLSDLRGTLNRERWRVCFGPHHEQRNLFLKVSGETGIQPKGILVGYQQSLDFWTRGLYIYRALGLGCGV